MVEIGYAVDPAYRRRGYARAALEALFQRAAREAQVRTVRVTISPDNVASYRLASQCECSYSSIQPADLGELQVSEVRRAPYVHDQHHPDHGVRSASSRRVVTTTDG
jgi:predicted acetyltransferase